MTGLHRSLIFVISALLLFVVAAQAQTYIFGRADFSVGNFPTAIAAGDFNGGRLTDLAATNSGDNTIAVLLAKGDGTLLRKLPTRQVRSRSQS